MLTTASPVNRRVILTNEVDPSATAQTPHQASMASLKKKKKNANMIPKSSATVIDGVTIHTTDEIHVPFVPSAPHTTTPIAALSTEVNMIPAGNKANKKKRKKKNKKNGQNGSIDNDSVTHEHRKQHFTNFDGTPHTWYENEEEREKIRDFWLSLSQDERLALVKIEKETVLKKMKEHQRQTCSCSVCGRKRVVIEEELELLYDAYYEELEHMASNQHSAPSRSYLPQSRSDPLDRDDVDDIEDFEDGYESDESGFVEFGGSLRVRGGILTVAEDFLNNDGRKFLDLMEHLARRKFQGMSDDYDYGQPPQPFPDPDYEDEDDYDDYDDDDNTEDHYSEQQRMEDGRRMFQIFAAKMFEQRVLAAYRDKIAQEIQQKFLEELEAEEREKERRDKLKQENKEKKRLQKKLQKEEALRQQREQEEREAEEKKKKHQEEMEKERQRVEELRALQKAAEEEKRKKAEEERMKEQERRRKEAELNAKRQKEKEKKAARAAVRSTANASKQTPQPTIAIKSHNDSDPKNERTEMREKQTKSNEFIMVKTHPHASEILKGEEQSQIFVPERPPHVQRASVEVEARVETMCSPEIKLNVLSVPEPTQSQVLRSAVENTPFVATTKSWDPLSTSAPMVKDMVTSDLVIGMENRGLNQGLDFPLNESQPPPFSGYPANSINLNSQESWASRPPPGISQILGSRHSFQDEFTGFPNANHVPFANAQTSIGLGSSFTSNRDMGLLDWENSRTLKQPSTMESLFGSDLLALPSNKTTFRQTQQPIGGRTCLFNPTTTSTRPSPWSHFPGPQNPSVPTPPGLNTFGSLPPVSSSIERPLRSNHTNTNSGLVSDIWAQQDSSFLLPKQLLPDLDLDRKMESLPEHLQFMDMNDAPLHSSFRKQDPVARATWTPPRQ